MKTRGKIQFVLIFVISIIKLIRIGCFGTFLCIVDQCYFSIVYHIPLAVHICIYARIYTHIYTYTQKIYSSN